MNEYKVVIIPPLPSIPFVSYINSQMSQLVQISTSTLLKLPSSSSFTDMKSNNLGHVITGRAKIWALKELHVSPLTLFNYLLVLIICKTILKSKLPFQNICLFLIGFVIAVMDRAHLKLKMEYKQKKKVQKKLEFAVEKNLYYKVINKLNNFHCIQNVSSYSYD